MPKPKSLILSMTVDRALKSHNCQHNANHRIRKGDVRLGGRQSRSPDYYCMRCAQRFIEKAQSELVSLASRLSSSAEPGVAVGSVTGESS